MTTTKQYNRRTKVVITSNRCIVRGQQTVNQTASDEHFTLTLRSVSVSTLDVAQGRTVREHTSSTRGRTVVLGVDVKLRATRQLSRT